jgi:tyrosyl-tRNA synthetase
MAMKLSEELTWRGFVSENSLPNIEYLDESTHSFYWGTDPSADSLHIGHLASLMMCACFVRHGYTPYLLVGGATGQIGDPKETGERDLKSLEEIDKNKAALAAQFSNVIKIPGTTIVDNNDWFKDIHYIPFLREVGKQFSMTQLLDRKFVQDRIGEGGSGISYAEFSYSLIQGYDFLHLYRTYGIDLQLCGADQFGNCVSGVHLIRRLEGVDAHAYACPLIVDDTGRKFGKSEGNAIWLDENKTSVYDFYQYWLNLPDEGMDDYMKYYTVLNPDEVNTIMSEHQADPNKRLAQKRLAYEATKLIHGETKADSVVKITSVLFDQSTNINELNEDDLALLSRFTPTVSIGTTIIDALVSTKIASSKSDATRLISSGAISVNDTKVSSDEAVSQLSLIKKGKNKFILVR